MTESIPMPPRKWVLRIGIPILVLAAVAIILVSASWKALVGSTIVRAIPVVVREVETDEPMDRSNESESGDIVQAPGWVEADPFSVYAAALAEGVVKEVLVLEGDAVTANQPIATLIDEDAKLTLKRVEAVVDHLEADLAAAQAARAQLPTRIKAAKAHRDALADEVQRKTRLVESGAVAAGPVQRLSMKLEAATAEVERLQVETQLLDAKVLDAQAFLEEGEAIRDEATLRLHRMIVLSPIKGIVLERLVSPGSVINFENGDHGSHVLHLYDPTMLQVRADVPLAQAAKVGVGHPAEIIVDVLPGTIFTGQVTRFVHKADLQKNTVEAKVHINDPSELLKPDMLARVRILQPSIQDTPGAVRRVSRVFVPRDAISDTSDVMVIEAFANGKGTARTRRIVTGSSEIDGWIEVKSGLSPGDRIILDDARDGETVQVKGD